MALDFAAMLAAARAEARRQRAGDAASDGTDAPAAAAAAAPARSEEAEAQEVAAYLLRALKEGLGAPAVAAGWRDRPATAVPSAFVLEDFVSEAEEAELLELIEAAPRSRWTQLRARSLQNWGGHPRAEGMVGLGVGAPLWQRAPHCGSLQVLEPLPVFLQQLIRRLQPLELFGGAQANHVLINKYLAGQGGRCERLMRCFASDLPAWLVAGIMPHKDGPLYYPTVAIISLGSSATMDFFEVRRRATRYAARGWALSHLRPRCAQTLADSKAGKPLTSLFLRRRSLLVRPAWRSFARRCSALADLACALRRSSRTGSTGTCSTRSASTQSTR
jgi:hypothetical protein